ncbi:MAG: AbrB/MazE/SpoVT family DNA-binding domain-containing protein [Terriglobales bacterium]
MTGRRSRRKDRASSRILASSRLTSKSQTTVPLAVRRRLGLKSGDAVLFEEFAGGTVCLRRAEPLDLEYLKAIEGTLSEWNAEHDEQAYGDL